MKSFSLLVVCFLFCITAEAQRTLSLDNTITGIYSKAKSVSTIGFNYVGSNSIDLTKHLSFDLATNYSVRSSQQITENEFIQREVLDYHKDQWNTFVFQQYNYSLVRQLLSDTQIGIGAGLNKSFTGGKVSLSYATLYQQQRLFNYSVTSLSRHSVRLKTKYQIKHIGVNLEVFYQPAILNPSNAIWLGAFKVHVLPKNPLSFTLQGLLNYRTESIQKQLYNITIGLHYRFSKTLTNKKQ